MSPANDLLGDLAPHHPVKFWIWSEKHTGWRCLDGSSAYTSYLRFAHKFTRAEVAAIVQRDPGDIAFAVPTTKPGA